MLHDEVSQTGCLSLDLVPGDAGNATSHRRPEPAHQASSSSDRRDVPVPADHRGVERVELARCLSGELAIVAGELDPSVVTRAAQLDPTEELVEGVLEPQRAPGAQGRCR